AAPPPGAGAAARIPRPRAGGRPAATRRCRPPRGRSRPPRCRRGRARAGCRRRPPGAWRLSLEYAGHGLVPVVLPVGLPPIAPERLHDRRVLHGEEDRLSVGAGVLVPGPGRDHEEVPLLPVEPLAVDHAPAAALEGQVDGAPGVSVRLRPRPGTQELDPAAER